MDSHNMERHEERYVSFFAQPGILIAIIGGTVIGLLCAILIVMFIIYRMRKKDENASPVHKPMSQTVYLESAMSPPEISYAKRSMNNEFFA